MRECAPQAETSYFTDIVQSPYGKWFQKLNAKAAAKVTIAIDRIDRGAMTNVEWVGTGVYERKIDFGPGYRIYFGTVTDGRITKIIILLHGGMKKGQARNIALANRYWKNYKIRKRRGEK